jgi:flagellar assembly factor FliW
MNMTIQCTRFGTVEYAEDDVVIFEEGLIGFGKLRNYVLLSLKPESPFRWLQSIDEPAVAFLVTDPNAFVSDYDPLIDDTQAQRLNLGEDTPRLLLTTATVPKGHPENMTLNMAAPIVINALTRRAKQLVLDDHAYTIKHRVFPAADRSSEKQAA